MNIITGLNDAGKTTVLESLFLLASGPAAAATAVSTVRPGRDQAEIAVGDASEDPWLGLFHRFETSAPIEFATEADTGRYVLRLEAASGNTSQLVGEPAGSNRVAQAASIRVVEQRGKGPESAFVQTMLARNVQTPDGAKGISVEFALDPPANGPYMPASMVSTRVGPDLALGYSEVRKARSVDLMDALKGVDARIENLEVLVTDGRAELHAQVGGVPIPFRLLGDGPDALAKYLVSMAAARNGILLIDEIGNGLHYSILPFMWRTLYRTAKRLRVQIFATTHSRESVVAAAAVIQDEPNALTIYRLSPPRDGAATGVAAYSGATLSAAIDQDIELR